MSSDFWSVKSLQTDVNYQQYTSLHSDSPGSTILMFLFHWITIKF